jgi:hypothetical protein
MFGPPSSLCGELRFRFVLARATCEKTILNAADDPDS